MNGYSLSRKYFNWTFENPHMVKPIHTAIYFFCIEHCNRLGWKENFGFPTQMTMEAIGVKSYNTYSKALSDLVKWGFIIMKEKSKNQYSANIVALSNFDKAHVKAHNKALDKALLKHTSKHCRSTVQSTSQSIDSIDKPLTINHKPLNQEQEIENLNDPFSESVKAEIIEIGNSEPSDHPIETAIQVFMSKYPKPVHVEKLKRALVKTGTENWQQIIDSLESYSASLDKGKFAKSATDYIEGEYWKQTHKPFFGGNNAIQGRNMETVMKIAGTNK